MDRAATALTMLSTLGRTAVDRLRGRPRRPGWSFATELVARAIKAEFHRTRHLPIPEHRAHMDRVGTPPPPGERVPRCRAALGGVPGWRFDPPGARIDAALLYLHGGGYCFGSVRTHGAFVSALARRSGLTTYLPEYRLAPEHPFPAAIEDAEAAYGALLAAGQDPRRLVVAGESAGGGLTLALLQRLRDTGRPLPAAAAVVSPWVDHTMSGPSIDSNAPYDFADRALAEHWSAAYLAGADPRHPLASPVFADLEGLPPLLVQVGGAELLHDEVVTLVERAGRHGVEVTFHDWPDMFHVWQFALPLFPEATAATDEVARYLASALPSF